MKNLACLVNRLNEHIQETPSGRLRNDLCDSVILLQSIIISEAKKDSEPTLFKPQAVLKGTF